MFLTNLFRNYTWYFLICLVGFVFAAAGGDHPSSLFNRFDSFNSVQGDGARGSGFHSDDESNIFSAPKPFSAKQSHVSDGWKAF